MCLSSLRRRDSLNDKRYNWSLNLKDLLTRTGYEYLWTTNDPADIIANKQNILNKLQTQLVQADLERAAQSDRLQYLTTLQDEQRLCKFFSLGLQNVRILAQLRINQTNFYWKEAVHELLNESKCTFCNSDAQEDIFHFLVECKIHKESQTRFFTPLQRCPSISRTNLIERVARLSIVEAKQVVLYTIVALNRRRWFNEI
jgi:hypothetical protein